MGRLLTRRYSELFEKRFKNPFRFAYDVHKSGKTRELVSFVVWELFHRLRLFPKKKYVRFDNGRTMNLENEDLVDPEFDRKVEQFFKQRGLDILRSEHNWKLLFTRNGREIFGCLYPDDRELFKSVDNGKSIVFVRRFPERIKSIFVSSQNTVFVCVKGAVYTCPDGMDTFKKTLDLGSPVSFFRHNNGMTELPNGTLIIAEYGNIWDEHGWRKLAYLYISSDGGETWQSTDFLIDRGTNKHVHLVKYSRLLNRVFMADGDNYKRLWVTDSQSSTDLQNPDKWEAVNRFHIQMGGHTSMVENGEQVLFGTDYMGGTNFLVGTKDGKRFEKTIMPDPYRRSPIDNMVMRKSGTGSEIWANLPFSTASTRALLMYTANGGGSWYRVFEYNRSRHVVWLVSSSHAAAEELYFSIENLKNGDRVVYKVSG